MPTKYPYVPLPTLSSFRLLKVTSLQEDADGGKIYLEFSLDVYKLDEACPEYVALSYTWGPPYNDPQTIEQYSDQHQRTIAVSHNGQPQCEQLIGRNLFDALIQIHRTKWQSYLWIDAICINQSDLDEREVHVQFMTNIYSSCKFVVAWLGFEPAGIEDILWWYGPFLQYIVMYTGKKSNGPNPEDLMPRVNQRSDSELGQQILVLQGSDFTITASRLLVLFDWFSRSRYWNRIWIRQELTLPQEVCFLVGRHELAGPDHDGDPSDAHNMLFKWLGANITMVTSLVRAVTGLALSMPMPPVTYNIGNNRAEVTLPDHAENPYRVGRMLRFGYKSDESDALMLLELLFASENHLSATDLRDKVYGLLGIVSRCARVTQVIHVTYKLTIQEVLKAVTVLLLTKLPYMTCFSLRPPACYPRLKGLPSWAIDLTTNTRTFIFGGISMYRKTAYNAYHIRDPKNISVNFHGDTLQLYGHYCGDISQIAKCFIENSTTPGFNNDLTTMKLHSIDRTRMILRLMNVIGPTY